MGLGMNNITPVEVAAEVRRCGPSLTLVAKNLGLSVGEAKRMLKDEGVKSAYQEFVDTVLELISRLGANKTLIAQYFGVQRSVVNAWFTEDPRIRSAEMDYYESMMDVAEYGLHTALQKQERWAIERMMDSRYGEQRGFGKKIDIDLTVASQQLGINLVSISEQVARSILAQDSGEDEVLAQGDKATLVDDLEVST